MYSLPLDVLLIGHPGPLQEAALACLQRQQVCAVLACGQTEALAELKRRRFDAVLLQGEQSELDLAIVSEVARLGPQAAIILLTSEPCYQFGLAAVRAGADEHLALSRLPEGEVYRSVRFAVERRRAEQATSQALAQVHQAQKMEALGRVAAGMTHDFRNLVTIILGNCQILKRLLPPDQERLLTPVDEIYLAGQKASNVVGHLLQFARNQSREVSSLDLNELVGELQPLVRPLLANRIHLNLELCEFPLPVLANPTSLEQIMMNLVVNAVDALGNEGHLHLATSALWLQSPYQGSGLRLTRPAYAMLTVADSGCGMEPEVVARIFEPFFTTKSRGTGLGLSTVFTLAREMGGELSVSSQPGVGTAFRLLLPTSAAEPDQPRPGGARTALILDAEVSEQLSLRGLLEGLDIEVIEARHASELKRMLKIKAVDLVLADLSTLQGDRRSGLRAFAEARTVWLSELPASILKARGIDLLGAPVLEKPFSRDRILKALQALNP